MVLLARRRARSQLCGGCTDPRRGSQGVALSVPYRSIRNDDGYPPPPHSSRQPARMLNYYMAGRGGGVPFTRFAAGEPAINRYSSGGAFGPHTDQQALTLNILLRVGCFEGGGTAFWAQTAPKLPTSGLDAAATGTPKPVAPPTLCLQPTAAGTVSRTHATHTSRRHSHALNCILCVAGRAVQWAGQACGDARDKGCAASAGRIFQHHQRTIRGDQPIRDSICFARHMTSPC